MKHFLGVPGENVNHFFRVPGIMEHFFRVQGNREHFLEVPGEKVDHFLRVPGKNGTLFQGSRE